jgi:hypothetical protein
MVMAALAVLSLSVHKEHRFILFILPLLLVMSVEGLILIRSSKFGKYFLILLAFVNLVLFASFNLYGKT